MGVGGHGHAPVALTPGKARYPLHRWEAGPVCTSGENLASPTGFDPRTVNPVASRYTEWVIPAQYVMYVV